MRVDFRLGFACQAFAVAALISNSLLATEPAECRTPRLSDIGWTDITLTTAMTAGVLEVLGYEPTISLLSPDVTYEAMKSRKIDIFLGTWIPGLENASKPYRDSGAIQSVRTNLIGAKSTLAVPRYTYNTGVHSLADLAAHKADFGGVIYGLSPGSNKPVEDLIANDVDGLGSWKLDETSEAGMLAQVTRSIARKQPVVFYAWAPHPMNTMFDIAYLSGGEEFTGPDFGASTVLTDVRAGYLDLCPNLARLLNNLAFTVDAENEMMTPILQEQQDARATAVRWIRQHSEWLKSTLAGVKTFDGRPGYEAAASQLGVQR